MADVALAYDDVGAALRDGDLAGAQLAAARFSRVGGPARNEWRVQVTAYGRRVGVPLPAWAEIIGTHP